jgi:hypothetical protein
MRIAGATRAGENVLPWGRVFIWKYLCLAQGEGVDSGLRVGSGVEGAGLAVGAVVGVGLGVGIGGAGMGMMKRTMLRTTIRLRTQKATWRVLTCDLREPRFTANLPVG